MTEEQQQVHNLLSALPDSELIELATEFGAALDVSDGKIKNRGTLVLAMSTGGCPGCGRTRIESDVAVADLSIEPVEHLKIRQNKKGKVIRYFDQHSHSYKNKIVILE